jgi:hypothetical protein
LPEDVVAGSLRWRSTQVVWVQRKTAPGACGNGYRHERERKVVQARATNGVRMSGERRHEWEGVDNVQAPTSTT